MTPRERFNNIMQFKPVDKLPVFEVEALTEQAIRKWIQTENFPIDRDGNAFFRYSQNVFTIPAGDQPPIPCFLPETVSRDGDTFIKRDKFGFLIKDFVGKNISPLHYVYVGAPLKTRADWEEMKKRFDPTDPRRVPVVHNAEYIERCNNGDRPVSLSITFGPARGIKNGYMFGFDQFLELIAEEPELFEDIFDFWSNFIIKFLDTHYKGLHLDAFTFHEDGMAYNASSMVGPNMFRELYKPYVRRVVDYVSRAHGTKTIGYYSSGNLKPLMPVMIESGINMTTPVEVQANMDVIELSNEFGKDMCYIGNISRQAIMDGKDAIDKELQRKLQVMFERGGFIPAVDDQLFPDMTFENAKYCIDSMVDFKYK